MAGEREELARRIAEVCPVPELGRYEHGAMCRYIPAAPGSLTTEFNALVARIGGVLASRPAPEPGDKGCPVLGHDKPQDRCPDCMDEWRRRAEIAEPELAMALEREEARRQSRAPEPAER